MEATVIEYLKSINIMQLLAMGVMFWTFYNRLDKKIDKLSTEVKEINTKLSSDIKEINVKLSGDIKEVNVKLGGDIKDVNSHIQSIENRLCKIEGILHTQDCCVIKSSNELRKAE